MFRATSLVVKSLAATMLLPSLAMAQVPASGYSHPLGNTGGFRPPPGFGGLPNRLPAPTMTFTDPFGSARAAAAIHDQYNTLAGLAAQANMNNNLTAPTYQGGQNYATPNYTPSPTYSGVPNAPPTGPFYGDESQLGGLFGSTRFDNSAGPAGNTQRMFVRRPSVNLQPGFLPPQQSDGDVLGRVQKVLTATPALAKGSNVQATLDGPTLVLRGTVASDYEKQVAGATALLEPGVSAVRNELTVAAPVPGPGQ